MWMISREDKNQLYVQCTVYTVQYCILNQMCMLLLLRNILKIAAVLVIVGVACTTYIIYVYHYSSTKAEGLRLTNW